MDGALRAAHACGGFASVAAAGDGTRKETLTVSFHTFLPSEVRNSVLGVDGALRAPHACGGFASVAAAD